MNWTELNWDGDCSHDITRHLLLGRKVMTNLNIILKRRDSTLPTMVHLVKDMVFPVVMYGCVSWTIKKAEHWRTNSFELCCWRRLLRVPWTAGRSNHLILCRPLLFPPSIFPSTRVFSDESALCSRWPEYRSFSFNISPSSEHSGLISFTMDWLDLLAVQGTLKSLLHTTVQKHQFFGAQLSL